MRNGSAYYKACDSCAVALVNADMSHMDDDTRETFGPNAEAAGWVTMERHEEGAGYFDCWFCGETALGDLYIFRGEDRL